MSTLSDNLKSARKRSGFTQQQVADRFGITRGAVAQWEAGTIYPDVSRLADIAEYLDCSLDLLFRGKIEETGGPEERPALAKFWMVHGINQRPPAHKHWTFASAEREAKRLSVAHPGTVFVVLEAITAFVSESPRTVEISVDVNADDGIPF